MYRKLLSPKLTLLFVVVLSYSIKAADGAPLLLPETGSPAWKIVPAFGWTAKPEGSNSIIVSNKNNTCNVTFGFSDLQTAENAAKTIESYVQKNEFTPTNAKGLKLSEHHATGYRQRLKASNGTVADRIVLFAVVQERYVFHRVVTQIAGGSDEAGLREFLKNTSIISQVTNSGVESGAVTTNAGTQAAADIKSLTEGDVLLTVTGIGKNFEEAQRQALRDAIMQTCGVFVSASTEVAQDKLKSDAVSTITNGSIKKFAVLSKADLPDGGKAITLRVVVSTRAIKSYFGSENESASIAGELFAFKIKQQQLNEKNEVAAVKDMVKVLRILLQQSLVYSVSPAGSPSQPDITKDVFSVPIVVSCRFNSNISAFVDYFFSTVRGLALTSEERSDYEGQKRGTYPIALYRGPRFADLPSVISEWRFKDLYFESLYLRSKESIVEVRNLLCDFLPRQVLQVQISDDKDIRSANGFAMRLLQKFDEKQKKMFIYGLHVSESWKISIRTLILLTIWSVADLVPLTAGSRKTSRCAGLKMEDLKE